MWGSIYKNLSCDGCDAGKELTFDYLLPMGLQISYSIIDGDNKATQLAYYLKTKNNNLSFRYRTLDLANYDPVTIGVRWFNKSGFTIEASNSSSDNIYTDTWQSWEILPGGEFYCYDTYNDYYYY